MLTFAENGKYQTVENEYDSLNRLTKVKTYPDLVPNGDTTGLTPDITQYTYDAMGNILTMSIGTTTPSVTTYAYNSLNQLTSKTDALGRAETYTYNLAGDMLTKTDRNGTSFSYSYDTWGNPLSVNAANGTKTQSVSYTYDILGNRLSMTDEHGTTTYTNDFLGRVTQESRTDFRGNIVNQYTYDKFGNVTQSNINGHITQNTFDNLNRITAQTSGNLTSSFSYNSANQLVTKITNGITSTYGYNDYGYVKYQSTPGHLWDGVFYDNRGNLSGTDCSYTNSYIILNFTYDGQNRLKTNYVSGPGFLMNTTTFLYDEKSNKINQYDSEPGMPEGTPTEEDKTFDLNNRDVSCTFDNNGNMLEDENGVIYEYDLFNRMVSVDAGIGAVFEYSYDGDGKRIRKTSLTEDVYFIWDGTNLAEQKEYYLGQLTDSKKFIYGTDLSYCITNDDVWTYYTNIRGDIVGYVDSEGNAVEYKYDAWGNLLNPTEGDENPFRYAGEYFDAETGFIYLRNRYYDPSEGRFTQEDPIQDGLNWYVYCSNNPVMFVDPLGLEYIVVSGSEYDSNNRYKYNFIEPAITKLKELSGMNNGETITWIVSKTGYSNDALSKMKQVANEIGVSFQTIESADELLNYINSKSVDNAFLSQARQSDKIEKIAIFSHGLEGSIALGYNQTTSSDLSLTKQDLSKMNSYAFHKPNSAFYSCNTATGGNNSFAQAWVNITGGRTWAAYGRTEYGQMNSGQSVLDRINRNFNGFNTNGSRHYPIAASGGYFKNFYLQY